MAVSVRLGGCDYMPGGTTVKDACEAAVLLARHGADMISISGGMNYYTRRDTLEPGWFKGVSGPVREAPAATGRPVPVMLTGGIRSMRDAQALLDEGACDLVGIGRPKALLDEGACDLVGIGRPILNNERWAAKHLLRA